ncbi:MAG TPA: hypothetical protein ENK83_07985, partial [Aliiroseovarius sp.]|nr:hypothetical protein [Aliiroseovarius sp.]
MPLPCPRCCLPRSAMKPAKNGRPDLPVVAMHRRGFIAGAGAAGALTLTASPLAAASAHAQAVAALTPARGRLLHGTFPGGFTGEEDDITVAQVKAYEAAVGKHVAWVMFSHNWFQGRRFPSQTARWILAHGSTPYVRLMLRSDSAEMRREPKYTLKRIAAGKFDADLARWGRDVAALGAPVIAEYGTEMNGEWFRWNGRWNGRAAGAKLFRAAYRRIIEVTRAAGAQNIVWVFHVNHADWPNVRWNRFENYYPGDDVIDWCGVSVYSMLGPDEDEPSDFVASLDQAYRRLRRLAPSKPVIVSEFGTDIRNPREPAAPWADRALG